MKNRKTLLIALLGLLVLAFGYYFYVGFQKAAKEETVEKNNTTEEESAGTKESGEGERLKSHVAVEKELPASMNEFDMQRVIHHMSHAKVYADKKWGHYEPTKERINRLIEVLESEPARFKHYDLYIDILQDWQKGDFTNAVRAHNQIWTLQGGTVGKATRLLTEAEVEKYRKKHFK